MSRPVDGASTARKQGSKTADKSTRRQRSETSEAPRQASDPPVTDTVAKQAIRLSFLIHDVSRMRRTAFDQLMKPLGVTRAQWWVLAHLSRHDGMMQTQLADALDVGKASLGNFLEKLESSGLIERRDDPIDKRAKRVYMARAGHQILKQMMQEEVFFNERILRGLTREEREDMIRTLTRIKTALSDQIGPRSASPED
jgi:DNA-binding MarR family transcriptional regulator